MFDIGWPELLIIAVVTILVVGPKEIPTVLRTVMSLMRKIKDMAREFQSGIDDIVRESELDEIKRDLEKSANIKEELEADLDPTGELSNSIGEIETSVKDSLDTTSHDDGTASEPSSADGGTGGDDDKKRAASG